VHLPHPVFTWRSETSPDSFLSTGNQFCLVGRVSVGRFPSSAGRVAISIFAAAASCPSHSWPGLLVQE